MIEHRTQKLGEILCSRGLIERKQLHEALEIQKTDNRKLGEVLIQKGWIQEDELTEMLAKLFQISFVRLSHDKIDKNLIKFIPQDFMRNHKVLPLALDGNCLTVATNNPLDVSVLQEIQYKSGLQIHPVMASLSDIEKHLQKDLDQQLNSVKNDEGEDPSARKQIIRLVDGIMAQAIQEKASDIHFESQKDQMRVRFRIDGVLYEKKPIPLDLARNVISRIKVISQMDVAENRRPQDGRISLTIDHEGFDIRLSTLPDLKGENLVLRILSKNFINRSFDSLGMDQAETSITHRLIERPYGLILVTGPTGAGKTTTLYSILNLLNRSSKNIISVEDPVEYEISGITQTAVNNLIGYTFANAIRHILRHDPDIIMVGEIRDVETAEIAIRAALTGHLVLSTMHTNTAAGAMTRLLEMNIEPFLISSAVNGVIAQRLVRKLCPHCHSEYQANNDVAKTITQYVPFPQPQVLGKPVGCERCLNTGYWGRTGVFEILEINQDLRSMILKSASERDLVEKALAQGMKTLPISGMNKVIKKITSLEEIMGITFMA
jgi:type IV pilus assembly protein PilB